MQNQKNLTRLRQQRYTRMYWNKIQNPKVWVIPEQIEYMIVLLLLTSTRIFLNRVDFNEMVYYDWNKIQIFSKNCKWVDRIWIVKKNSIK